MHAFRLIDQKLNSKSLSRPLVVTHFCSKNGGVNFSWRHFFQGKNFFVDDEYISINKELKFKISFGAEGGQRFSHIFWRRHIFRGKHFFSAETLFFGGDTFSLETNAN